MYYDIDAILIKMESLLKKADIPYKEPDSIGFSCDMGTAHGACWTYKKNGKDHYAIRINPFFDSKDVPLPYVEALVCHELLHCEKNRQHGEDWEKYAAKFVKAYPEYALSPLTEATAAMDMNGDIEGLPFDTDDCVVYCPSCGKRQYFRIGQKYGIEHALERPCPECQGKTKLLFKGRKNISYGKQSIKSDAELKKTYVGAI